MYKKPVFYQARSRQIFIKFRFLAKLFETCIMGAYNSLDVRLTTDTYKFVCIKIIKGQKFPKPAIVRLAE